MFIYLLLLLLLFWIYENKTATAKNIGRPCGLGRRICRSQSALSDWGAALEVGEEYCKSCPNPLDHPKKNAEFGQSSRRNAPAGGKGGGHQFQRCHAFAQRRPGPFWDAGLTNEGMGGDPGLMNSSWCCWFLNPRELRKTSGLDYMTRCGVRHSTWIILDVLFYMHEICMAYALYGLICYDTNEHEEFTSNTRDDKQ